MTFSRWEVLWIEKHVWWTDLSNLESQSLYKSLINKCIFLCVPCGICMFKVIKAAAGITTTMALRTRTTWAPNILQTTAEERFQLFCTGKRRSLPLSRFSQRLRPAPSSSTWDVWAGVSASLSAVEERTFTGRQQEKTQYADEIDIELRNCLRRRRNSVYRQRTV